MSRRRRSRARSTAGRLVQIGQSMVEYAIIAALIAMVAVVAVKGLGGSIEALFTNVTQCVNQAADGADC